jgi:hypothetical protein
MPLTTPTVFPGHPTGVIPELDIEKPRPDATLQVTPLVSERQLNGPSRIVWPYSRVGVFWAALARQFSPGQGVNAPPGYMVTDCGGVML